MDFISNLIKRPISLVLNETSTTMDKYPISASLPNTSSELENKGLTTDGNNDHQMSKNLNHNKNAISVCSSSSDNMTDFIGVPDEFLDEFKDILPPAPLSLQHSDPLTQSLLDIDIAHSFSITPPPPFLTPAMRASQTIDELLSHINDNLQQAGLNDDVLAIATPPSNYSELTPFSSKGSNNSKHFASSSDSNTQLNISKTSTTAAGSANSIENSSQNKFCIEPESETTELNNYGVNKLSNKFVGLTEFDEAKIPELPCDLNPNIEEQYNVTFEKCFIPTLKAQQNTTVSDENKFDKTHLLLPTETDVTSSDNETFSDCNDEKDPLAATFAEPASLDVTTDLELYQSATNKSFNSTLNNTMENIADIIAQDESHPLKFINQIPTVDPAQNQQVELQFKPLDDDEPMDVDMDATLEILHNTSNNIQHVEKVLQHAENILQHLEDKKDLEVVNIENITVESSSQKDLVVNKLLEKTLNKSQELEIEKTKHCLNESIEMPINKEKTINTGSVMESLNEHIIQEDDNVPEEFTNQTGNNINLIKEDMNTSIISNSSAKSTDENKHETKLILSLNSSANSQKNLTPNSPTFPIQTTQKDGFPRSPKAVNEKLMKALYLEKSDFLEILESQAVEDLVLNNINGNVVEPSLEKDNKRHTFVMDNSAAKVTKEQEEGKVDLKNEHKIFCTDMLGLVKVVDHKRRTFTVEANESESISPLKFPSLDKAENALNTLVLTDNEIGANKTFLSTDKKLLLPSAEVTSQSTEGNVLNTSFEPMDVDDSTSQNTFMALTIDKEKNSQQNSQSLSPPVTQLKSNFQLQITSQSQEPRQPIIQPKSQSPPLHTMQPRTQSPILPFTQSISQSPTNVPISQSPPNMVPSTSDSPTFSNITQNESESSSTSPESTSQETENLNEEQASPPLFQAMNTLISAQPLSKLIQKRPSIRDARARAADTLSAKEQSNIKVKDEKDIVVEQFTPSPIEDVFHPVSSTSTKQADKSSESLEFNQTSSSCSSITNNQEQPTTSLQFEDEFNGNNFILNPSDFEYLLTKGNNYAPVDRNSILCNFDPLLNKVVLVDQGQQQLPTNANNPCLSPTIEEDEHNDSNHSFVIDSKSGASAKLLKERSREVNQQLQLEQQVQQNKRQLTAGTKKKNATMSVDVIKDMSLDNDCNKAFENSNSTQSEDKQINYKMDELEKKIKNEVLKTEDIEKKLKDAEQREEALIKRITEKDKTIAKMTGVIEAYEKAIAELIADKEQITQHYEKQLAEVKADRDSNYHHLTSLETTFSDLHVKYEKSKEMTCQLKESEETLQAEKRKNLENLHLQEQRYDKMKNHAMQQLEIANKKLESLTRDHSIEVTKLKALLKKEEIARSSINEQLAYKTKENEELVKICDELISGQGSNFSFEPFDPKKH